MSYYSKYICKYMGNLLVKRQYFPLGVVEAASSSLVTQTKEDQSELRIGLLFCFKTGFLALF